MRGGEAKEIGTERTKREVEERGGEGKRGEEGRGGEREKSDREERVGQVG